MRTPKSATDSCALHRGGDVGSDYRCSAGGTTLDAVNVRLYACRGHTISTRTSADFALLRGCHQ
jgi:hypothetical protein